MAKDGALELWEELAEQASREEDPDKLMELVAEINRLLDDKDNLAKDRLVNANSDIARLLEQKQALLEDGSTKPHTK